MDEFTSRTDHYRNFNFRVEWADPVAETRKVVAAASEAKGLDRGSSLKPDPSGAGPSSPHVATNPRAFGVITLDRGVGDQDFVYWAHACVEALQRLPQGEQPFELMRDVWINLCDGAGTVVGSYLVRKCVVKAFAAPTNPKGSAPGHPFEHVTLEHRGWSLEQSGFATEQPRRRRWRPFRRR
jgi:phage tail-like protein